MIISIVDKKIEKESWKEEERENYEYEHCVFKSCDFTQATFLSNSFIDCEFYDSNLALTNLTRSILNGVKFVNCKILGVKFDLCNDFIFDVSFEDCILDYSSFVRRKMPNTKFKNCSLKGVSFIETNLKQSFFDNCNLDEAIFLGANLQEVNFTSSYNYTINLQENFIRKTRFSKDGLDGLLRNFDLIIDEK